MNKLSALCCSTCMKFLGGLPTKMLKLVDEVIYMFINIYWKKKKKKKRKKRKKKEKKI